MCEARGLPAIRIGVVDQGFRRGGGSGLVHRVPGRTARDVRVGAAAPLRISVAANPYALQKFSSGLRAVFSRRPGRLELRQSAATDSVAGNAAGRRGRAAGAGDACAAGPVSAAAVGGVAAGISGRGSGGERDRGDNPGAAGAAGDGRPRAAGAGAGLAAVANTGRGPSGPRSPPSARRWPPPVPVLSAKPAEGCCRPQLSGSSTSRTRVRRASRWWPPCWSPVSAAGCSVGSPTVPAASPRPCWRTWPSTRRVRSPR